MVNSKFNSYTVLVLWWLNCKKSLLQAATQLEKNALTASGLWAVVDLLYSCMKCTAYPVGVHSWTFGDEESQYRKRVKRGEISEEFWTANPIEYRINSAGFRDQEFDPSVCHTVALGCSLTFGLGVPESWRWSNLMGATMNLSEGGAGQESCFRFLRWDCESGYRIGRVLYLEPIAARRQLWRDDIGHGWSVVCAWGHYGIGREFQTRLLSEPECTESQARVRWGITGLARTYGFTVETVNVEDPQLWEFYDTLARDCGHPGARGHQWLADNWNSLTKITL